MAFPPARTTGPRQWAGAPPPKSSQVPPRSEAPNPVEEQQVPAVQSSPAPKPKPSSDDGKLVPPAEQAHAEGEGDPQMMARAHQALSRLLMDGGLTREADALLMQAMQKLVEKKKGLSADGDASASNQSATASKTSGASKPPFLSKKGNAPAK